MVVKGLKMLITKEEAADYLGVSLEYFEDLINKGHMPMSDETLIRSCFVVRYKEQIDEKRKATLDELAKQAQELKMGY